MHHKEVQVQHSTTAVNVTLQLTAALLWRRCCLCDLHIFNKNAASRAAINDISRPVGPQQQSTISPAQWAHSSNQRYLPPGGPTAAINDISRPAGPQQQTLPHLMQTVSTTSFTLGCHLGHSRIQ